MTFPKPALEKLTCPVGTPWSRTYELKNGDGSPIDGTRMEALFQLWDQGRLFKYGDAVVTWITHSPAVIKVEVEPAILAAVAAGGGGVGYGDLLILNNRRRQYLVEVELTPQ
jgi:hypothetical protein